MPDSPPWYQGALITLAGLQEVVCNCASNVKAAIAAPQDPPCLRNARGKSVLITGGTSGVGMATAIKLAQHGASVTVTSRSAERACAAAEQISASASGSDQQALHGHVQGMSLDTASLADVRRFAEEVQQLHPPPDIIICNAGIMCPEARRESEDGFEYQFACNYLGHFVLAAIISAQRLKQNHSRQIPLRITMVSSMAHKGGFIDLDDLQAEKKYVPFKSYAQSKLANIMAANELNRRCKKAGRDAVVTASSVHPGLVRTPLAVGYFTNDYIAPLPGFLRPIAKQIVKAILPAFLISPPLGAASVIHAALGSDGDVAGKYVDGQRAVAPAKAARDQEACAELWHISCKLAGMPDPLPV